MFLMEANSKGIITLAIQVPCKKKSRDLETSPITKITPWLISLTTRANSYQDRNKMTAKYTLNFQIKISAPCKEMPTVCLHHWRLKSHKLKLQKIFKDLFRNLHSRRYRVPATSNLIWKPWMPLEKEWLWAEVTKPWFKAKSTIRQAEIRLSFKILLSRSQVFQNLLTPIDQFLMSKCSKTRSLPNLNSRNESITEQQRNKEISLNILKWSF